MKTPINLDTAVTNQLRFSQQFDVSPWFQNASGAGVPTIAANSQLAPDGTLTAYTISCPPCAAGQWTLVQQNFLNLNAVAGKPFVFSIWLKAPTPCTVTLLLEDNGGNTVTPNGFQNVNVTTSWQRFTAFGTYAAALLSAPSVLFGLDGVFPATTFFAWGAQVEPGLIPTSYNATTTTAGVQHNNLITWLQGATEIRMADLYTIGLKGQTSSTVNLIPDPNGTALSWSVSPGLPFSPTGGALSGGCWTYTGTGVAAGFYFPVSQIFSVTPGATYTLSGYIDARKSHGGLCGCRLQPF
jgi:hypothetical protein